MKKKIAIITKHISINIVLCLFFTLIIVISYLLPSRYMESNLKESIEVFKIEGVYPKSMNVDSSRLDNWTDSIMLMTAAYKNDMSIIKQSVLNIYPRESDKNPVDTLINYFNDDKDFYEFSYSRYWNGYLIILRPLLLVLNYQNIRLLILCVQLVLFVYLIFLISKEEPVLLFPMCILYLFFNPVATLVSMQFSAMIHLLFITMIIILKYNKYLEQNNKYITLFLIVGIITNIFDFWTYPLITLGIPLSLYLCLNKTMNSKKMFVSIIINSIFWFVGYSFTWIYKWIAGSVLSGEDVVSNAINQIIFRSSDKVDNVKISMVDVIVANIKSGWNYVLFALVVFASIIYVVCLVRMKTINNKNLWIMLLIALYPIIWEIMLRNHEYIHSWFTFRNLGVSLFAFVSFLAMTIPSPGKNRKE